MSFWEIFEILKRATRGQSFYKMFMVELSWIFLAFIMTMTQTILFITVSVASYL